MKPWTHRQQATGTWCVESGSTIAHVYGRNAEKHARLIAAAPEILAALTECADRLSSCGLWAFVGKNIDPIIAKANGKSPKQK